MGWLKITFKNMVEIKSANFSNVDDQKEKNFFDSESRTIMIVDCSDTKTRGIWGRQGSVIEPRDQLPLRTQGGVKDRPHQGRTLAI